ncbi:hypothetical protein Hanom_Chr04g00323771 [Helianthus anomalus]
MSRSRTFMPMLMFALIHVNNINRVSLLVIELYLFVEPLKKKIAELEQDKIEKYAMMEKIEEGVRLFAEINEKIQLLLQNLPPTYDALNFIVLLLDNFDLYRVMFGYV